ncbi:Caudovirales tail fibre assembly protein [Buttiauxella agrestis]|uniref:Caudovirales tail fibre assembly protein n=1 Tax=Buttiauxella agrestis TaxID=82977 RepID=A0A381C907_9ENTR|nr:Caudovirales tail fibre assembly protein [Buttiauxella agrestis]
MEFTCQFLLSPKSAVSSKPRRPSPILCQINAGTWPIKGVDIDEDTRNQFFVYPEGKTLGADDNGYPVWIDVPPPTHDELVMQAEEKKQKLI